MEKLSVIIPVHNAEKYLERCINSVQNSTYPNIEIILIENGSSDRSLAICEEIERKLENVRLFVSNITGLSRARNIGLENANGEWITFVDSDDYISPYMYEELISTANKKNTDVTLCDCVEGEDETYVFDHIDVDRKKCISSEQYFRQMFLRSQTIYSVVWNKIYKKRLLQDTRFDENLGYTEDREFNFRVICKVDKIGYTQNALYYYYRGDRNSICNTMDMTNRMGQVYGLQKSLEYAKNNPDLKKYADYISACLLQNANFRKRRARACGLSEQINELNPIIKKAVCNVKKASYLGSSTKMRFLLEHYAPILFDGLVRIRKLLIKI